MTAGPGAPILRDVAIYNPDLLRKEELVAYFIARRPLLDRILQDLGASGAAQHHLLIGTRGMGKTTLLKRIRFAVEDDARLSAGWLPLTFPEEQYGVSRLSELYLNCVDALSDALEDRGQRAEVRALDAEVEALSSVKDEDERSRRALRLLLGAANKAKKRLLLLLDNIDILFDRLKAQAWALREVLSREDRLLVIGASASHPEETYTYDAPFYDFFKVHELRGLPEAEARELLLHLADLRGATGVRQVVEKERARLRTIYTLSGGNPRTLVLLFFLLAQSTDGDAQEDLERLLDHITPPYKARMDALSPQGQKIIHTIAICWHPVTAADVAARAQLEVGLVSSQITRLVREGVLERCATPGGTRSAYQVAERLFNVWCLMRQSRRGRRRLGWLVEFLHMLYAAEEATPRAEQHAHDLGPASGHSAALGLEGSLGRHENEAGTEVALASYDAVQSLHPPKALRVRDNVESEAERAARAALAAAPGALESRCSLARVLLQRRRWDEPAALISAVIQETLPGHFESIWPEMIRFFAECVSADRTKEGIALLDSIGFGERWLPLRAALAAVLEGRETLLAIAPELRAPAEKIHDDLLALAGLPATPPSSPRSRRNK